MKNNFFAALVLCASFSCHSAELREGEQTVNLPGVYSKQDKIIYNIEKKTQRKKWQACCCMSTGLTLGYFAEYIWPVAPIIPRAVGALLFISGTRPASQAITLDERIKEYEKHKQKTE